MNYENMTDDQLREIALQKMAQPKQPNIESMSDDELRQMALEKMLSDQNQPDRTGEAFVQGFGQGASLGYMPQLQAGASQLIDTISGKPSDIQALEQQGFKVETLPEETYTEARDKFAQRGKELEAQHPIASGVGQLAGGLTTGLAVPAGAAAKGAGLGARIGTAVATGAGMGLLINPGETEGELSPVQFQERLKNAGVGAITGLVAQGGVEGVAKAAKMIRAIPSSLKRFSELKSFKGSGAMLKDFRREFGRKKVNDIGRTMLENNVVALGDDVADIAKKSQIMAEETGNKIGSLYQNADDLVTQKLNTLPVNQAEKILKKSLNTSTLKREFLSEVKGRMKGKAGGNSVVRKIEKTLDEFMDNGDGLTLSKWKEIRQSLDEGIDFAKENKLVSQQRELVNLRNKMQDMAKSKLRAIDDVFGGNRIKEITKLNKDYGNLKTVSKMASDKVAREESNAMMGLRERISGGVGAVVGGTVGGPMGALAGGAIGATATKIMRQYGNPATARIADSLGKMLEQNPNLLGKFAQPLIETVQSNPAKFVTTVEAFMNDPEFKKKVQGKRIKMPGQL